jgi:hypothetical protein
MTIEEAPQHRDRETLAAVLDQALSELDHGDVRRAADQAHEVIVMGFDPPGSAIAARGLGEISHDVSNCFTQRTALAMLILKSLAAASRDSSSSTTAPTTRLRRSSESAIPAASFSRRES